MGSMRAEGMAQAVKDGLTNLDAALSYHLTVNHFPPLPVAYIDMAKDAISAANQGKWSLPVSIPTSCPVWPNNSVKMGDKVFIAASRAVEIMHLEAFLDCDDDGENWIE